jgi:hypothetical protein
MVTTSATRLVTLVVSGEEAHGATGPATALKLRRWHSVSVSETARIRMVACSGSRQRSGPLLSAASVMASPARTGPTMKHGDVLVFEKTTIKWAAQCSSTGRPSPYSHQRDRIEDLMSVAQDQLPYYRNVERRARMRPFAQWGLALAGAAIAGFTAGLHSGWAGGLATGLVVLGSAIPRARPEEPQEPVLLTVSVPPDADAILILIIRRGPTVSGSDHERSS